MLLYKKLNVGSFEVVRQELENFTKDEVPKQFRYWDVPWENFKTATPELYKFVMERRRFPIRLCRFYLTPSFDCLKPHVDGLTHNRSPLGLNIPIIGYENTTMTWYDCPEDNFEDGPYGFNNITASRIKNLTKLKAIDKTVIDCPTFVRTDVVHSVFNLKSTPRLVLSIRFNYIKNYGNEFHEVFNLEGL